MLRSPRDVQISFNHAGLTHYGGAFFLHEFLRVLQLRHGARPWFEPRRHIVARRLIETSEATAILFALGRFQYRCWVTNLDLSPAGVRHFDDGRAALEVRIRELRQDFALTRIPTRRFAANALYLEIVRLADNLVTAFQRLCLPDDWQSFTL